MPSPTPTPTGSVFSALVVLERGLPAPDDLELAPNGAIYFSDVAQGTVNRLENDGSVTHIVGNLREPEGMVFLPDGTMVIAEQGHNRLVRYDFASQTLSPFLPLPNETGHPGVDNITFDAATQTILVPDSPNGTLLRVSLDGTIVQTLARGMARPVGAAIEGDGNLLVADENANAILRVPAEGGAPRVIARMPVPDDVIVDATGQIYAIARGDHAIHQISSRTGADSIFWRGLAGPQGIIFDADGNLIVTDPGHHRIVKIAIH